MAFEKKTAYSIAQIIALGNEACGVALSQGKTVDLVVPDSTWRDSRKLLLRSVFPAGVHVQSYDEWVTGLWELYGDGRRPVAPVQRRVLLRPLLAAAGLLKGTPSARLVQQLAEFAQEAIAPGLEVRAPLDAAEERLVGLVEAYRRELEAHGLAEQAQQEALLAGRIGAGRATVLEALDLSSPHRRAFIAALSERAEVTVVSRELDIAGSGMASRSGDELEDLRALLYTGAGGLEPTGAVAVGEARGAHAVDAVLCDLVGRCLDKGAAPGEIAVVFQKTADSYPHAQIAFARAGVPFKVRFSLPAQRTPLGSAFCDLMALREAPGDEASYEQLAGFIATPYAGIDGRDARALQMRWRERAKSTPEERLDDILEGFAQGNANAKTTKERLAPLAELLQAEYADCVRLMFEHGRAAHLDADALLDDRAAACAILEYLGTCGDLGAEPRVGDAAICAVPLERGFGDPENAVLLADGPSLALAPRDYVIVAELDSLHYPMARQDGPFDALSEKLGIAVPDDTVIEQRVKLLDLVEGARKGIAFCRSTHDAQGNESVQSALWDEVMTAYRRVADEKAGRAIQDIPVALMHYAVQISEAELFDLGKGSVRGERKVVRGQLAGQDELAFLAHDLSGKETPFSPTGIEDYYRCPYRWFACRRVGYNSMDNEFDAAAQGNLAHAAMERFYKKLQGRGMPRVTPENLEIALQVLSEAFDEQVAHDEGRNRGGLFLRTEQDRYEVEEMREMLLGLVRRDATFLPGYVPTYFELALGKGTGTMLEYGGVPVRGKVDRIDVDAQGNAVIIDYKLSGLSQGYGLDPDHDIPGRIQTDIYARLVQRHFDLLGVQLKVVGSVYRSYSHNCLRGAYSRAIDWGEEEEVRVDRDALPRSGRGESYDEYLDQVEATVAECMERLRAGHIEPDPLDGDAKQVCEYCKALSFCPRGES